MVAKYSPNATLYRLLICSKKVCRVYETSAEVRVKLELRKGQRASAALISVRLTDAVGQVRPFGAIMLFRR